MAIALDNSQLQSNSGNSTWTQSHTCNGSDRYLIVVVGGPNYSDLKYAGVSMTLLKSEFMSGVGMYCKIFGLVAPASGANNLVLTHPGGAPSEQHIVISSWTGVDQSTPTGTAVSTLQDNGSNSSISVVASSAAGEVVVDGVAVYNRSITAGAGQTSLGNTGAGYYPTTASSYESGAGSVTMSWSWLSGQYSAIVAVPLKPSSGGGGGLPFFMQQELLTGGMQELGGV